MWVIYTINLISIITKKESRQEPKWHINHQLKEEGERAGGRGGGGDNGFTFILLLRRKNRLSLYCKLRVCP